MKTKSQKDIVKMVLQKQGKINNFHAIMRLAIWRLGAIICDLRKEGMDITGDFMKKKGIQTKIYEYKLNK